MKALFLLATILLVTAVLSEPLIADRVHLMDSNKANQNYLFRGNMPVNQSGDLDYNLWKTTLIQRAKEEFGVDLPSDFYIVDYSLISNTDSKEKKDLAKEKNFFSQNPSLGELRSHPLHGSDTDPSQLSESERDDELKSGDWNNDKIDEIVAATKQILDTKADKPVVVYYHCEHGVDRTGELSGAYYMTYLGWSYSKTIDYNFKVDQRSMDDQNVYELNWYCWYLNYSKGAQLDCSYSPSRLELGEDDSSLDVDE